MNSFHRPNLQGFLFSPLDEPSPSSRINVPTLSPHNANQTHSFSSLHILILNQCEFSLQIEYESSFSSPIKMNSFLSSKFT
ncbi:unnamed protein product [Rotaria magnacalcarata]